MEVEYNSAILAVSSYSQQVSTALHRLKTQK